jgi:hypothetical protein
MVPTAWYAQGIRLLGRTAVECTRDGLANRVARDIAGIAARRPKTTPFTVVDPFAGSCNTLYWILPYVPNSQGLACEFDRQVYEVTKCNIAGLNRTIDLQHGDYRSIRAARHISPDHTLIFFVAPPWGKALNEVVGLDLQHTTPITNVVGYVRRTYRSQKVLLAIQVYEKVDGFIGPRVERSAITVIVP